MRIYIKRRYEGRGVISVEECCAVELRNIDFYLVNSEEELIKVVARLEKLGKDKTESKKDYKNRIEQEKMDHLRSMKLHGQLGRDTDKKSWDFAQKWKFETGKGKLVVSSTGVTLNTN